MVDKLILKATHRGGKEFKLFVLRNVDCGKGCDNLKSTIKKQLQDDIIQSDFDVGIDNGGKVISLRTQADVLELWAEIKCKSCQIWCDRLKVNNNDGKDSRAGAKRGSPKKNQTKRKCLIRKTEDRR